MRVIGKEYGKRRISEHETTEEKMNKRCVCAYLLRRNFGQEGEWDMVSYLSWREIERLTGPSFDGANCKPMNKSYRVSVMQAEGTDKWTDEIHLESREAARLCQLYTTIRKGGITIMPITKSPQTKEPRF